MQLTREQLQHTKQAIFTPNDDIAATKGCWYDAITAERYCSFFSKYLKHSKGQWAKQPFVLNQMQSFIISSLFGWKRPDGTRRFRIAFIEIPKKNGKSTLAAGVALCLLTADGEQGAEVYSAATTRDQASIVYREAANMVKASAPLTKRITLAESQKFMGFPRTNSFYKALSSDTGSNEGLNIHGLIFDELHALKKDTFWDALRYGVSSRKQPLIFIITTSGDEFNSVCYDEHCYALDVYYGVVEDIDYFSYVLCLNELIKECDATADREDLWKDKDIWKALNPGYGTTINSDTFESDFKRALETPRKRAAFKRYRLNYWSNELSRWIDLQAWDACIDVTVNEDTLRGQVCYAGLDLSSVTDMCSLALFFPSEYALLIYYWLPEDVIEYARGRERVNYQPWKEQGFIYTTPGNIVDYEYIRHFISGYKRDNTKDTEYVSIIDKFLLTQMAVDRWNSSKLVTELKEYDGIDIISFGQGYASMSMPCKDFEKLVLSKKLRHAGNPVLRWNISNAVATQDAAENIKLVKDKSSGKIDGLVAAVMAQGLASINPEQGKSVYEERGVLMF